MTAKPHSPAWYDSLAERQEGYHYPWKSELPTYHGEDVFRAMVRQHLSTTSDVLEVACAHGELALEIAPQVRSIVAYDRIASWIARAQNAAQQQGFDNVTFLCHDSSLDANDGQARLPGEDD
jgi:ubiquinone/menaquinone biosynthesis C-methylase UbiE